MKKHTLLLFHPRTFHSRNYRWFHVPYSLLSVAANVPREQYEVVLLDNNVMGKDDLTSELQKLNGRPLCVGISAMIGHQITDGIEFAKCVRRYDERIPIVWGGALPTVLPDLTIQHEYTDMLVRGQGQVTFLVQNQAAFSVTARCDS